MTATPGAVPVPMIAAAIEFATDRPATVWATPFMATVPPANASVVAVGSRLLPLERASVPAETVVAPV